MPPTTIAAGDHSDEGPSGRALAMGGPPTRRGVRVLRRPAQPRGDHAGLAALWDRHAGADRDGAGRPDRVPDAAARAADSLADAHRGVGARAALRRRPAAR